MSSNTPTFAVVGAVNPGKSSIVSTLAENDRVVVSSTAGETEKCEQFALEDLFIFYDTPGFQNALAALEELELARNAKEPLHVFRDFIARHHDERAFKAECRLLEKIVEGAGILYVVDGSKHPLEINLAEMEILRLTGRAHMAVINRTSAENHVAEWKRRLDQHFKVVWEFDAQRATFSDRIELLSLLAGVEQSWAPKIREAVQILREDRVKKIDECAEIVVEMLCKCLAHRETSMEDSDLPTRRNQLDEKLKSEYRGRVGKFEADAHRQLIAKFEHNFIGTQGSPIDTELFNEETWKFLGLSTWQLALGAGVAGGATGLGVDALFVGHSFGLAALIGGAAGAGGALVAGKIQPDLAVEVPLDKQWIPAAARRFMARKINQRVSGRTRVVRCAALDYPWILLDRAVGTFAYASQRSHARRDQIVLNAAQLKASLDEHGISSQKLSNHGCERLFAAIRAEKLTSEQRGELRKTITQWLEKVERERIDFKTAEHQRFGEESGRPR